MIWHINQCVCKFSTNPDSKYNGEEDDDDEDEEFCTPQSSPGTPESPGPIQIVTKSAAADVQPAKEQLSEPAIASKMYDRFR